MSLKKIFLKSKFTYKIYLYYNLYIRHKCYLNRKQYSQWGEDKFIIDYFKEKNDGIYLDIGCFHPVMYSNTCLLHKKGWSGINIDINPTSIDLFDIVRPNDFNICTTVGSGNEQYNIFYDDPFSPVNTLSKDFYKKLKIKKNQNYLGNTINSKTIDEIIKISKIKKKIDYINIDVEGMDYDILSKIKINELKPDLISIETHNVDGTESKNYNEIKNLLQKNDFILYKRLGPSTLYKSS